METWIILVGWAVVNIKQNYIQYALAIIIMVQTEMNDIEYWMHVIKYRNFNQVNVERGIYT